MSSEEIDEHRVGGHTLNVPAQFARDHGARSGGGTNETEHGSLDHGAPAPRREIVEQNGQSGESQRLEGQMSGVPAA